jgi:hypothetical protein
MPITKATASSVAPAAKGDLVVGSATNDAAVLGVGTNDQVLTADSSTATGLKWATAASGGGMTLLSTTTLSGSSTNITSISGSYKQLVVFISGISVSSSAYIECQPNSSTSANNFAAINSNPSNNDAVYQQSFTNTNLYLNGDPLAASNTNNAFCVVINNYASSSYYKSITVYGTYAGNASATQATLRGGGYRSTSAITNLNFVTGAGTFGAGQVLLYGVS